MNLIKEMIPYVIAIYRKGEKCILLDEWMIEHEISYRYPLVFMHHLCFRYGCSLKERRLFATTYLHIRQKVPILINDRDCLLFFPTCSVRDQECLWISYHHIQKIQKKEDGCIICFRKGAKLYLNCDPRSIRRQMRRCAKITEFIS